MEAMHAWDLERDLKRVDPWDQQAVHCNDINFASRHLHNVQDTLIPTVDRSLL